MGLSFLEIRAVLLELAPLANALLQEVYQPSPTELVLEMRVDRESRLLLLSTHARLSRIHLIERRPPNPRTPFPFQMLCRKELSGRLVTLAQEGDDRIVRLAFQGAQRRTLIAELTDRHANLFLIDDDERILGTMAPARTDDARQLGPGRTYQPLPPPPQPLRATDRFLQRPPGQSYLEAVERFFVAEQRRQATDQLRSHLLVALRRELKRLARRHHDLAGDLARAEQAERHRRYGDLLQIHLATIPRGRAHVVVQDSFQEDPDLVVEVPLDPQLDPIGNVQRHYRLYRKYDASIPIVLERIDATEQELTRLGRLEARVEAAEELETLQQLEREAALPRRVRQVVPSRHKSQERLPFLRYLTPAGVEIRVGRSGKENDMLTFRLSRGNDFWFHVRGRPGAHVVVPARGAPPDLETLLDAAALALRHGGASPGDRGDVSYTRVKYVRKIPGEHPGLVTYSQDKTLYVELTPERLSRVTRLEDVD